MHAERRTQAFTLIELLIAGTILVILLGVMGAYLAEQTKLDRTRQARAQAQDNARLVVQLVSQDLQSSGSLKYAGSDGQVNETASLSSSASCSGGTCLVATDGGAVDSLAMQYVTTLRDPSTSCRSVGYHLDGGTLYRADEACDGSTGHLVWSTNSADFAPLADGVVALDVRFECSNGSLAVTSYPDPTHCPAGSAYVRSAVVTVVAASTAVVPGRGGQVSETVTGQSVTCPDDRICYTLEQEVLMPNLKDG